MIKLPNFNKTFDYENNFYLSCQNSRLSKIIAHYELFKMIKNIPGDIVECGIFKGCSFVRWAGFRDLVETQYSRKLIGFDTFDFFPETENNEDKKYLNEFIKKAGNQAISKKQLIKVLKNKGIYNNIKLIEGDIIKTVPEYCKDNPHQKIALLNLDTDIYEPSIVILEYFWERIVKGGILILDDYGTHLGETKAVDEFLLNKNVKIYKFPFAVTPCYIIKD